MFDKIKFTNANRDVGSRRFLLFAGNTLANRQKAFAMMRLDPARCVVLVPVGGAIETGCEDALKALEIMGYPVRRVRGYSAIDAARCQMATDALGDGFDELMWIDSDIVFDPNDVDKLRSHGRPMTCGLYPKKGQRQFANSFLPGTPHVRFGVNGGLIDILYCGFGFTHVRREVFDAMRVRLNLTECNRGFRKPLVPYFSPLVASDGRGEPWYLNEDFALCERARQSGYVVQADTTIRLWHVGTFRYSWEDAGRDAERFADYTFHLSDADARTPKPVVAKAALTNGYSEDWFTRHVPTWHELLASLKEQDCRVLEIGVFEGRSTVWLLENILTHPASTLTYIDTFAGGAEHTGLNLSDLESRFLANTAPYRNKLIARKGRSDAMLRDLPHDHFDYISIDGSHEAADVLSDAVLSWPLLKTGGLICFDDYEWWIDPAPERSPKLAIDAFLNVMRSQCEVVRKGYQVWVRKRG